MAERKTSVRVTVMPPPSATPALRPNTAASAAGLAIELSREHPPESGAVAPPAMPRLLMSPESTIPCAWRRRCGAGRCARDPSISGHLTESMQHHYSTVNVDEQRQGIAKVIEMTRARAKRHAEASDADSASGGAPGTAGGALDAPEPHVVVRYGGRRRAPTKSGKAVVHAGSPFCQYLESMTACYRRLEEKATR
jgi:hypothetical protein